MSDDSVVITNVCQLRIEPGLGLDVPINAAVVRIIREIEAGVRT
jgi:hypothetical protein